VYHSKIAVPIQDKFKWEGGFDDATRRYRPVSSHQSHIWFKENTIMASCYNCSRLRYRFPSRDQSVRIGIARNVFAQLHCLLSRKVTDMHPWGFHVIQTRL
jgi:hypothetical protein